MSIKQKVSEVNQVFDQLGAEIAAFQSTSQLSCVAGCGKCCQKPDINASVLEFLPLAYALYQEGRADEVYDEMTQLGADDFCHFFRPVNKEANQGYCGSYQQRGLICRLFGFSARKDKNGLPTMITCKVIKEGQAEKYQETDRAIKSKELPFPTAQSFICSYIR